MLRLGVISSLLADSLVSGFTTAAAMHVFTSQIRDLFGLSDLPRRRGAFKLILVSTVTTEFCLALQTLFESSLSGAYSFRYVSPCFAFFSHSSSNKTFAYAKHLGSRGKRFL